MPAGGRLDLVFTGHGPNCQRRIDSTRADASEDKVSAFRLPRTAGACSDEFRDPFFATGGVRS